VSNLIPVVILAGGRGSRMASAGEIPKPMVSIGSEPLLIHIMRHYSKYGFTRFIICLGYLGRVIRDYFDIHDDSECHVYFANNGRSHHLYERERRDLSAATIRLVDTGIETSTAGRLRRVSHFLAQYPRFCVAYSDCLSNVNFHDVVKFHEAHKRVATVTAYHPRSPFGHLHLDEAGVASEFHEKPVLTSCWASTGFFLFERSVLDHIVDDDQMLEERVIPALARSGDLVGFRHCGYVQPVDTQKELELVNEQLIAARQNCLAAPWEMPHSNLATAGSHSEAKIS
jgi:glucose-1-phosphate cytidylyltransferase